MSSPVWGLEPLELSLDAIIDGYLTLFRCTQSVYYKERELAKLAKSDPKLYALLQKKLKKGVDNPA